MASTKLANKLQNAVVNHPNKDNESSANKLKVYVQINTSGEESKSGAAPGDCLELCRHIVEECPNLQLKGLMTIGAVGDSTTAFGRLRTLRDDVQEQLGLTHNLGLSMGMSGDFQEAIREGATNVRVGSTIFGARDYSNK